MSFRWILVLVLALGSWLAGNSQTSSLKTIIVDAGHGLPDPGAKGEYSKEADITLAFALQLGERIQKEFPNINVVYTRKDARLPKGLERSDLANHERADMANEAKGDLFISIHADSEMPKYKKIFKGYKNVTVYVKGKNGKKIKKSQKKAIYHRIKLPHTKVGSSIYIIAPHKKEDKYGGLRNNADIFSDDIFFGEDEEARGIDVNSNSPEMKARAEAYSKRFFKRSNLFAELVNEEFKKRKRVTFGVKQRHKGIWVLQATGMPSVLIETGYICTPADEKFLNSKEGQKILVDAIIKAIASYSALIAKNQYVIPKEWLANNSESSTVDTLVNASRQDTFLDTIKVTSSEVRVRILNQVEKDASTFTVRAGATTYFDNKSFSHTNSSKVIPLNIPPNNSLKLRFNAENLREIDSGHLELTISDGKREWVKDIFIKPEKNVILPIVHP